MNVDNIEINTQSSIRLVLNKVIYFDPYKINNDRYDADIIFITHDHYDHMDIESINKIKNNNTIIVAPKSMEEVISKIEFKEYIYLNPGDDVDIDGIKVRAISSYNINKVYHPRLNNWLGYIISFDNISYYIAGDTDKTKEAEGVRCDIALIPIGGKFTMDVDDATELVKIINPRVVIPTHYGSIVGNRNDCKRLRENLSDTKIDVIEKI